MSTTFYIVVYLIVSPNQVDIILNKVELDEYKNYKLGTIERKSFGNSPEAFEEMQTVTRKFKDGHQADVVFIYLSAKDQGGVLGELFSGVSNLTLADVEAYARSKNYPKVNDEVFVEFCQDRELKNVARNK